MQCTRYVCAGCHYIGTPCCSSMPDHRPGEHAGHTDDFVSQCSSIRLTIEPRVQYRPYIFAIRALHEFGCRGWPRAQLGDCQNAQLMLQEDLRCTSCYRSTTEMPFTKPVKTRESVSKECCLFMPVMGASRRDHLSSSAAGTQSLGSNCTGAQQLTQKFAARGMHSGTLAMIPYIAEVPNSVYSFSFRRYELGGHLSKTGCAASQIAPPFQAVNTRFPCINRLDKASGWTTILR